MDIDVIDESLANQFWTIGHGLLSNGRSDGSSHIAMRRFKSNFGVCHRACAYIWDTVGEANRPSESQLIHLLYALLFLKLYNTEHQFKAITGRDEKTFRKYAWRWAHLLAYYLDVIDLENRFDGDPPDDLAFRCFVSLDGTDFSIYEPTPFDAKWYSHKLNGPGLRYEIGICLRTGDIVLYG